MANEADATSTPHVATSAAVAGLIGILGVTLFTVLLWVGKIPTSIYITLLVVLAFVCAYVNGPNGWTITRDRALGPGDTPRTIALWLLMYFGVSLGIIGLVAAMRQSTDADREAWLDLFKSGFLLLGGGVTTIVGYYFGSRQTTQAFRAAAVEIDSAGGDGDSSAQGVSGEARPIRPLNNPVKPQARPNP